MPILPMKITQISKDFDIKSKDLLDTFKELGIDKKSGGSADKDEFELFLSHFTMSHQIKDLDAYRDGRTKIKSSVEKKEKPAPKAEPVKEVAVAAEPAPVAVSADAKAILISRLTCPNCRVAEQLLGKAGIAYEKLIAEENADLCRKYGVKGAPTLIITDGENHQNYYSVPEIKKYLASL